MILKFNLKNFFLPISGLLLFVFITSCGGEVRDKSEDQAVKAQTDDKIIITKHRAFDHFTKGDLYERTGDLEKAADEYRLALFYDPNSDEIRRSLAMILYDLGRYDEALDVALKIADQSINDRLLIAGCYNGLDQSQRSIEIYEDIAKADSVPQFVIENLAKYYTFEKNEGKAEKYYRWLIENGDNVRLWRSEWATALIEMDKPGKAENIYQAMVDDDSLDYGAYLGLAGVKMYEGDTDAADSLYRYVANRNWENAQILSMLLPALVDINDIDMSLKVARQITELYPQDYLSLRRYGILLFTSENYTEADSIFARIIDSVNDDPVSYYYRGRIAQQKEEYARAETYYGQAIAVDDTMPEAWVNLALVRGLMENQEGALATLDSALIYCPADSVQILFYTGIYLTRQEKFAEAIGYYQRVLKASPDNIDARFNLAAAYERSGQYDEAENSFLEILEVDEDNAMVLNYLGYMYADQGIKLDKAEKLIKKALKIDPDNGAYLDSYAWVMYKKGKYKEALKYQLLALDASQDSDAVLYDHMGDIYFALNKPQEAATHWEKALELDPENEAIKNKLQR
jgi:tetratricopeptide (TPR) repeat protein